MKEDDPNRLKQIFHCMLFFSTLIHFVHLPQIGLVSVVNTCCSLSNTNYHNGLNYPLYAESSLASVSLCVQTANKCAPVSASRLSQWLPFVPTLLNHNYWHTDPSFLNIKLDEVYKVMGRIVF